MIILSLLVVVIVIVVIAVIVTTAPSINHSLRQHIAVFKRRSGRWKRRFLTVLGWVGHSFRSHGRFPRALTHRIWWIRCQWIQVDDYLWPPRSYIFWIALMPMLFLLISQLDLCDSDMCLNRCIAVHLAWLKADLDHIKRLPGIPWPCHIRFMDRSTDTRTYKEITHTHILLHIPVLISSSTSNY